MNYYCPKCGARMRVFPMRRPRPGGRGFIVWYVAQCPRCGYMKRVG